MYAAGLSEEEGEAETRSAQTKAVSEEGEHCLLVLRLLVLLLP